MSTVDLPTPLGRELWVVDFEYVPDDRAGTRDVICVVAREARSGRLLRHWRDEFAGMSRAPFDTGEDALFVAHSAQAELACFDALGWPRPARVLDTLAEHRVQTNGTGAVAGLIAAAVHWGILPPGAEGEAPEEAAEKTRMRDLILSGGPWSEEERGQILDYCQSDVDLTANLLLRLARGLQLKPERLPQALLRGRYAGAVTDIEALGVPVDVERLEEIKRRRHEISRRLIDVADPAGLYDAAARFSARRFGDWLADLGIAWPALPSGRLALDDDTFKLMAEGHPEIVPVRELRKSLAALKSLSLAAGPDGRLRGPVRPYAAKTGRNQPTGGFIFSQPKWLRSLIRPGPGRALAYVDYGSQEVAIAAALSGDEALWEAYASGDPYIAFAIQAGIAPAGATKASHPKERAACKTIVLAVQYGQSAAGMAARGGLTVPQATELLLLHKRVYAPFWRWSEQVSLAGVAGAPIELLLGWAIRHQPGPMGDRPNPRTYANFPVQGTGSEILRAATVELRLAGVDVCALVHDATLTEHDAQNAEAGAARVSQIMSDASEDVLGPSRRIRCDADIVRYPDRYRDESGAEMWRVVCDVLGWQP